MLFIKTRGRRIFNLEHITGFAVEEQKVVRKGKRMKVFAITAYLPRPLYPAVLGVYFTEETAEEKLEKLVETILKTERGVIVLETEI